MENKTSVYLPRRASGICLALVLPFLLAMPLHGGQIRVAFPARPRATEVLDTFMRGSVEYLRAADVAKAFSVGTYINSDVDKQVLYFRDGEVKITAYSSFVIVDEKAFQMTMPSYFDGVNYYVPVRSFFEVLSRSVLQGAEYNESRRVFIGPPAEGAFNIYGAVVESKANGTLIRVKTSHEFDGRNIVRYITDSGWLVVQVPGGRIDTVALSKSILGGIIRGVQGRQLEHSGELRFRLTDRVGLPEVFQVNRGQELHIALRNPLRTGVERADEIRKQWYMDTIVLDPGHGGKDGGAVGRGGLKEKTVTLDIARRIGRLFKQKTGIKVIYTRDEDVFVPLFQRTRMANEAGGKIFISIHANGVADRSAKGYETWLLAPANTPEAIEMARRENSVIALEESNHDYAEFSDESLILSTMAHSAWMRESESLGSIILEKFKTRLDPPNRGLKQADFLVLIGASMPNILVEIGFLSNRHEEMKLGQNEYRQKIARGIFEAIIEFKETYEGTLSGQS